MADIDWSKFTIMKYFENNIKDKQHLFSFYKSMYNFNPDVNGYYLTYFILPDFGGKWIGKGNSPFPNIDKINSRAEALSTLLTYTCIDCSPPNIQVTSDSVSVRTGSMPIATEVFESDTLNISFLDNRELDVYNFNYEWLLYMKATGDGLIKPSSIVLNEDSDNVFNYGSVDYMASIYIVKFEPDANTISYIGKATGVFPQNAPNKEIIGTRNTNSISLVPVTYYSSIYREAINVDGKFPYYDPFNENADMFEDLKDDFSNLFNDSNKKRGASEPQWITV